MVPSMKKITSQNILTTTIGFDKQKYKFLHELQKGKLYKVSLEGAVGFFNICVFKDCDKEFHLENIIDTINPSKDTFIFLENLGVHKHKDNEVCYLRVLTHDVFGYIWLHPYTLLEPQTLPEEENNPSQ